jgi:hypothetical protein
MGYRGEADREGDAGTHGARLMDLHAAQHEANSPAGEASTMLVWS